MTKQTRPFSSSASAVRIAVVDDRAEMTDLVRDFLEREGYEVVTCQSALELMKELDDNAWQISTVITDINMPGMSGLQLSRELKARRPSIPIILMTAFGSHYSSDEVDRAGAFTCLTKPFRLSALSQAIKGALAACSPAV